MDAPRGPSRTSMRIVVVCPGRNRPQGPNGQSAPMASKRRSWTSTEEGLTGRPDRNVGSLEDVVAVGQFQLEYFRGCVVTTPQAQMGS